MSTVTMKRTGPIPMGVRHAGRAISWVTPLLILVLAWEGISRLGLVSSTVLPPFSEAIARAYSLVASGEIIPHIQVSLYRGLVGLIIGAAIGVVIGMLMAVIPLFQRAVYPLVTLTYALPKSALIPIALLWLGVGNSSTILVIVFGTAVPMIISAFHGTESVPRQYLWSARSMGTPKVRIFFTVILPAALPQILTGLRMAVPLSFILVISAEMVAAFVGVGQFIYALGAAGNYASMLGAIILVMVLAFIIDQFVTAGSKYLLRWTENDD